MSVHCALPTFESSVAEPLRTYFSDKMKEFQSAAIRMSEEAKRLYEASTDRSTFIPYSMEQNYQISYNENGYFCVSRDLFEFEGGAQSMSWINAETFDLRTNQLATLDDLFLVDKNAYNPFLVSYVCELIKQDPGNYYDDSLDRVTGALNSVIFALSDEGLVLYFSTYTIAPYTTGSPSFTIPYSELKPIWKAF
jgi:hypothetical protein